MRTYLSGVLLVAGAAARLQSQTQPPSILITSLSTYGNSYTAVAGQVQNLPAGSFKVVTMILIEGYGWFVKPGCSAPFTPIRADGSWATTFPITGIDDTASQVSAFVVPAAFTTSCDTTGEALLTQIQNVAIAGISAPGANPNSPW